MTVALRLPPAPGGQQGPPTRAAASDSCRSLRSAHGSLPLTPGTACRRIQPREEKILRQDTGAWNEGYAAGHSGACKTARLHAVGTTESWSWIAGYIEGKAVRLARVETATNKLDENREH